MKLLIQNSLTGTLVNIEIDDEKRVSDILKLLEVKGDIPSIENKMLALMGQPLPNYMTIQAVKDQKGLKSNDLLVLIEKKSKQQAPKPPKAPVAMDAFKTAPSEEESLFNELMNLPTSEQPTPPKPAQAKPKPPASMPKTESGIPSKPKEEEKTEENTPEQLLQEYDQQVYVKMSSLLPIDRLEQYMKERLGEEFNRIRGAWQQLLDGSIELNDVIRAGIFLLKDKFINIFLEDSIKGAQPKTVESIEDPLKESQEAPQVMDSPERDMFSDNPFEQAPQQPISPDPTENAEKELFQAPTAPEESPIIEPEPIVEESEEKSEPSFTIPDMLLGQVIGEPEPEPATERTRPISEETPPPQAISSPNPKISKPGIQKKPLNIQGFDNPPKKVKAPAKVSQGINAFAKPSEVIESKAPKMERRSSLDAMKHVGQELQKVEVGRIRFESVEEEEIKSVDVGAFVPGTEFEEIRKLIYDRFYDQAGDQLKKLIAIAKANEDQMTMIRAEDLLTNLSVYEMIPVLIDAGDKITDNMELAKQKYEKAKNFAKTIDDQHYVRKIDRRLKQIEQRLEYSKRKKKAVIDQKEKLRDLVKDHIKVLSRENTLMSLEDIRKYCQIGKRDEYLKEIIIEMFENKEVYGKFFSGSNKVMFDKDSNREFVIIDKNKLIK